MKVAHLASCIMQTASRDEQKSLQTLKTICNSDTAFVAAVQKYKICQKLLKKAFLLSRTWQKLGQARTWKITVKALKAALQSLIVVFKRPKEFMELPEVIQKQIGKFVKSSSGEQIPVL
ncbi:MAG: hypothetical protein IPG42_16430 [Betaproteobacteria bacterium]|nr:hypothetical protein [Betaproteobacteria bacterium]